MKHCAWCGIPTPALYWCSDECEWEWREEMDMKDSSEDVFDDYTLDLDWEDIAFEIP